MITVKVTSQILRKRTQQGMQEFLITTVCVKSSFIENKHNSEWFVTRVITTHIMDRRDKQYELVEEIKRLVKSFSVSKIIHEDLGESFGLSGTNRVKRNVTILQEFATRFKLGRILCL